ncbi:MULTISPECIES: protein phosphatase 2C domain-containing protein [Pontibacillus]|uniref:Protein phosphatase 2C domain-containing protein n=1 Tax=Pontibacillus chungwhensis TaxID=265426 RepID=A0ABY8UZ56_9BACI|nr:MULTISPECIES: protein phosphatase 2C domain-containing protein [Pontibacillus]MCD5324114.1 protein phosphatase 2C domain-containing protein [Pontibacillus sp. HN14]WIF97829.1 protein phosphatase 2C domain-containing protein [Pontibacillus chungwhensis]
MRHISSIYEKGSRPMNEDRVVLHEEADRYAVVDGATGIDGIPGELAASVLAQNMEQPPGEVELLSIVKVANETLGRKNVREYGGDASIADVPKEARSTCGIAAIQLNEDRTLSYVQTGDCMIFVQYKDGSIRALTYDHVAQFDDIALKRLEETRERASGGQLLNDAIFEQEIKPILLDNRRKLNTKEGYPILDGSEEALDFLDWGTLPLLNVDRLLLLSDGLQLPDGKGDGEIWMETARYAFTYGLEALRDRVHQMEEEDSDCLKYPRFKKADDKSGVLISL